MPDAQLGSVPRAAARLLDHTIALIEGINDHHYTAPCPACDHAAIGGHIRHLLDHFEALAKGFEADAPVVYDRRDRGTEVERDRAAAAQRLRAVRDRFAGLDDVQLAMGVTVRVLPTPQGEEVELESTLARELAFVTHHAVHHHAIIKTIAQTAGVSLDHEFGRAPSTVRAETQK